MALTLAFDTSAGRCAVGLFEDGATLASREERRERGHAERLFPMIEDCFAAVGRSLSSLTLIAVCTGPGNFTGARIGVAAARGLALSTGARAIGVDRFEALAEGLKGSVCVALAGRGGTLHIARFKRGALVGEAATVPAVEGGNFAEGALVVGDGARALIDAAGTGRLGDEDGDAPLAALALIAARARPDTPRPAPRYLRPAAAAQPREAPATILP